MRCNLEVIEPNMELGDVAIDSRGVRVMAIKDGRDYKLLDLRDLCVLQDKANSWTELLGKYFNIDEVKIIKNEDLVLSNQIGGN